MDGFNMAVDGFVFTDEKAAQKACQEEEGIRYVKDRLDMGNPRMVLEMYHKLLAEQVFETPVGLLYLKDLQSYLLAVPELEKEGIEAIPVYGGAMTPQASMQPEKEPMTLQASMQAEEEPTMPQASAQAEEKPMTPQAAARHQETLEWYAEKLEESRQRERLAEYRRRRAEERTKESGRRLRLSLLVSLFFALVAIGVGLVTLTDNHPNILNYENKIIEKYQDWENDLESREEAIKEKELADNP